MSWHQWVDAVNPCYGRSGPLSAQMPSWYDASQDVLRDEYRPKAPMVDKHHVNGLLPQSPPLPDRVFCKAKPRLRKRCGLWECGIMNTLVTAAHGSTPKLAYDIWLLTGRS